MSNAVRLSINARIARITLARPQTLNVGDGARIAALISVADRIKANCKRAGCNPDRGGP
jgi:enoyl-CoA hydratase/carnithine racemase